MNTGVFMKWLRRIFLPIFVGGGLSAYGYGSDTCEYELTYNSALKILRAYGKMGVLGSTDNVTLREAADFGTSTLYEMFGMPPPKQPAFSQDVQFVQRDYWPVLWQSHPGNSEIFVVLDEDQLGVPDCYVHLMIQLSPFQLFGQIDIMRASAPCYKNIPMGLKEWLHLYLVSRLVMEYNGRFSMSAY